MYAGMPGLRHSFPVFADDRLSQALRCPAGVWPAGPENTTQPAPIPEQAPCCHTVRRSGGVSWPEYDGHASCLDVAASRTGG